MVFGELLEFGMFMYVIDEFGHKHKVRVKNEAHRQRLLAQNRAMKKKLAAKKKPRKPVKKTTKKR